MKTTIKCGIEDCKFNKKGSCSSKKIVIIEDDEYGIGVCRTDKKRPPPKRSPEEEKAWNAEAVFAIKARIASSRADVLYVDEKTKEVFKRVER